MAVLLWGGCGGEAVQPTIAPWPGDSWEAAEPESVGFASSSVAEALSLVESQDLRLNGVFLSRFGYEVLRAEHHPYDGRRHDVASVTKSVTATLIGIALQRGDLPSLDVRVVELLGSQATGIDDAKSRMTVEDLLTMRSGLDCGIEPGEVEVTAMIASDDWVSYALELPMRSEPGSEFAYCSPNTHLLSAILTEVSGQSALDYAQEHLFGPLGIDDVAWPADPSGISHGWGNLQMRPEDMAKVGYLWLRGGTWDGQRLLPADYVDAAWTVHADATTDPNSGYGYGWWIPSGDLEGVFEARGRGGQAITVWPAADIVVAWTGRGRDDRTALVEPLVAAMAGTAPLPADSQGQAELQQVLAALARPPSPVAVPALPDLAVESSNLEYQVAANPLGLEGLRWSFEPGADEAQLRLVLDGEGLELIVGLDGVQRFGPGPRGLEVGMVGGWADADTLTFGLHEVAGPEHLLLELRFQNLQTATLSIRDPGGYRPDLHVAVEAEP